MGIMVCVVVMSRFAEMRCWRWRRCGMSMTFIYLGTSLVVMMFLVIVAFFVVVAFLILSIFLAVFIVISAVVVVGVCAAEAGYQKEGEDGGYNQTSHGLFTFNAESCLLTLPVIGLFYNSRL